MRPARFLLSVLGTALFTGAVFAQGARPIPAFLDSMDEVTVWLPDGMEPGEVRSLAEVRIGGALVPVSGATARETFKDPVLPSEYVLAGSIQRALGGNEWDPADPITKMIRLSEGRYEFVGRFPAGMWEYKLSRGGSWEQNWGAGFVPAGENIQLRVPANSTWVKFVVDTNASLIRDSINNPGEVTPPITGPERVALETRKARSVRLKLARPISPHDVSKTMRVRLSNSEWRPIIARGVLDAEPFQFKGSDLGNRWSRAKTTFKVWSPVSERVDLVLFRGPTNAARARIPMRRGNGFVWYATVPGNLDGTYYQYHLRSYGQNRIAADISAYAASSDSQRSMVVDLRRTNPQGWNTAQRMRFSPHATDAIIYEAHVRDLSAHPQSGVKPAYRGKYLGVSQRGTKVPGTNLATGLDHMVNLGVTHLHLLPFQNFNPGNSKVYNWGYETTLFNLPEEQYSTNPENPVRTILDTKAMILGIQRAGIGVVLDVVYNHTVPSEGPGSAFWETVPYFYFRTNDRGDVLNESGVGNAVHDERLMVRKYLRESLDFWTREYRLDGYRFDLLGMFTPATVRSLAQVIRAANPTALIYGEPWTGGGPNRFPKGQQRGMNVAVFNDHFRNAFRGQLDGPGPGFVMGGPTPRPIVKRAVVGSIPFSHEIQDFAAEPNETVNYISAHDNLTFWDKVRLSMPAATPAQHRRAVKLGHAAVLLSQGVPFLEGGVEMGRTKGGNNNSYNAGDLANQYDWPKLSDHQDLLAYFKGLIQIRKNHPAFRLKTAAEVREAMKFLSDTNLPDTVVAWSLDGARSKDSWRQILVFLNGSTNDHRVNLPSGRWEVAVEGDRATNGQLRTVSNQITLGGLTATVLYRK